MRFSFLGIAAASVGVGILLACILPEAVLLVLTAVLIIAASVSAMCR
ncbi:MAG: hypothetical protein ACI4PQ_07490 [Butyricicoccaceae bacterium]